MLDPFQKKCYLLPRNSGDQFYIFPNYDAADNFCKENSAVLATIHSADVNSWLTAHSPNDMWVRLKGTTMSSDIPSNENLSSVWSPMDFNTFQSRAPIFTFPRTTGAVTGSSILKLNITIRLFVGQTLYQDEIYLLTYIRLDLSNFHFQ